MLYPVAKAALAAIIVSASPALAEVSCPTTHQKHRLAAVNGGDLYRGPVSDNATLISDNSNASGAAGWANVWNVASTRNLTLVCRYEGVRATVQLPVPNGTRQCRQDARSFVCR